MNDQLYHFIMLVTAPNEDDSAIYKLYSDPVFCKLSYTQPYEVFNGIRDIQLSVRRHDIFERPPVTISLDITEYLGHENDENFVATLKFLYDHRDRWHYIFVVRSEFDRRVRNIYAAARCYLRGTVKTSDCWADPLSLSKKIREYRFDKGSSIAFAELLLSDSFKLCRSDSFIDNISEEIRFRSGRGTVTLKDFMSFAKDENGTLNLIAGNVAELLGTGVYRKEIVNV